MEPANVAAVDFRPRIPEDDVQRIERAFVRDDVAQTEMDAVGAREATEAAFADADAFVSHVRRAGWIVVTEHHEIVDSVCIQCFVEHDIVLFAAMPFDDAKLRLDPVDSVNAFRIAGHDIVLRFWIRLRARHLPAKIIHSIDAIWMLSVETRVCFVEEEIMVVATGAFPRFVMLQDVFPHDWPVDHQFRRRPPLVQQVVVKKAFAVLSDWQDAIRAHSQRRQHKPRHETMLDHLVFSCLLIMS